MPDEANGEVAPRDSAQRPITREELKVVIRRAAELLASESDDQEESLSEDEAVRIATELGLPARHVRQALFELPALGEPETRRDYFGQPVLTTTRVVPGRARDVLRKIEDYLATREYLQVVRRRADRAFLMPADDAISNLARGLLRPSRRYFLSRANRVVLSVRDLDQQTAHVQIALDLSEQRRKAVRTGWIGGSIGGLMVGAGGVIALSFADMPAALTLVTQITAFAAGFAGTVSASLAATRAAFRSRLAGARFELEGLLDRAEHGQSLEPPPAPWRKRLQQRLLGQG